MATKQGIKPVATLVLFVTVDLILAFCMHSHSVGLDVSSLVRFGWTFHPPPCFLCATSQGSDETVQM